MIKVLHICASDINGGAARAAFRLHKSFSGSQLVDSRMLVRVKASDDERVENYVANRLSWKFFFNSEIKRRVMDVRWSGFVTENINVHSRADLRTGLLTDIEKFSCDIIHLHWLGNSTLSIEEIGNIQKPIVWTLHDMWAFCGAEHYSPDGQNARFRQGYKKNNRPCGEAGPDMNRNVWLRKKRSWKHPMTLVCPSRWMATCARESALFESNPVHCLPNPLDLDRWKPADRQNSRKLLGLPMDKRVVLFGAIGGESDLRKGADLLRLALEKLRERNKDIHLVVFGQSEPQKLVPFAYPVTFLGRLRDDFSLIAAYSAADVMVVPSRQEAFGQTASEAHACGAPVVAFDVGGLSDIVSHQRSGYLAKPFDTDDLAEGIASVLGNEEKSKAMSKIVRDDALRRFAMPVVANGYYEVYKNILS